MKIHEPSYYSQFHCTAGACPDSCCQQWEVLVDAASAARYRSLSGDLGDRLRSVMRSGDDGDIWFALENGRCPMWRSDGLCRIQAELGSAALCETCAQFPRLRHDYGDFVELGLELSCPEAAKLILSHQASPAISREIPGGDAPDYDEGAMSLLLHSRETVLALAEDPAQGVGNVLKMLLLYAYTVDEALNFPEDAPEIPDPRVYRDAVFPNTPGTMEDLFALFRGLEILTPRWAACLGADPADAPWHDRFRPLIRYFVERYWLQAVSDLDLASRAKFIVVSCLMIRHLPGDFLQMAQLYSKEIENDADNVEALLDAAFTAPALNDAAILRLLEE